MNVLSEQHVAALVADRRAEAAAYNRAARLRNARGGRAPECRP